MGNIFSEIGKRAGDLVSHPIKITKDTITNPKKGLKEWGDLYTHNEHKDQDLFQKGFGIHGWVGKHPQETAAAVVATIFGGWAAWGAYGTGAAGGATGSLAGGAGVGTAGTTGGAVGASGGLTAGASGGVYGSSLSFGGGAGSAMAYTPTASSVALGSGSGLSGGVGASGIGATGVGIGGESTASLGISGAGVTSFPGMSYGGAGSLGNSGGWLGSGSQPISSSMSWQDYAQQYGNNSQGQQNQSQQNQQQAPKPGGIDYARASAPTSFNTGESNYSLPNSTTELINKNNKKFTSGNFGDNY